MFNHRRFFLICLSKVPFNLSRCRTSFLPALPATKHESTLKLKLSLMTKKKDNLTFLLIFVGLGHGSMLWRSETQRKIVSTEEESR